MAKSFKANGKVFSVWTREDVLCACPNCKAEAIVELTPELKTIQPNGTTHVCHPGFGGCNRGFAVEVTPVKYVTLH